MTRPAEPVAGPPVVGVVSGSVTSDAGSRLIRTGASHPEVQSML